MKSILVHLDASPRATVRLALAQQWAKQLAADVNALYGVVPSMLVSPFAFGEGMALAMPLLAELDHDQQARARESFDKAALLGALQWLDGGSEPYRQLIQHALYADLVVLGQEDTQDAQTGALPRDLVAACITDTGKPTLVVPFAGTFKAHADQVLVAWKPTREAARAVTAALPWLRLATTVHVAERLEADTRDVDHIAALTRWLRLHGVMAQIQTHRLGAGNVGEALLSLAADTSAELMVMGCYGHTRTREWVLGGATRTILGSMTLPVLMVH